MTVVVCTYLQDLLIISRLLSTELVAGKADHDQTAVLVILVQFLQSLVLRSEATKSEESGSNVACLDVTNHFEAVLTIKTTLPLKSDCSGQPDQEPEKRTHGRLTMFNHLSLPGKAAFKS